MLLPLHLLQMQAFCSFHTLPTCTLNDCGERGSEQRDGRHASHCVILTEHGIGSPQWPSAQLVQIAQPQTVQQCDTKQYRRQHPTPRTVGIG